LVLRRAQEDFKLRNLSAKFRDKVLYGGKVFSEDKEKLSIKEVDGECHTSYPDSDNVSDAK